MIDKEKLLKWVGEHTSPRKGLLIAEHLTEAITKGELDAPAPQGESRVRAYAWLGKKGGNATVLVGLGDSQYTATDAILKRYKRSRLDGEFGIDIVEDEPKFIILAESEMPCCGIKIAFEHFNIGRI